MCPCRLLPGRQLSLPKSGFHFHPQHLDHHGNSLLLPMQYSFAGAPSPWTALGQPFSPPLIQVIGLGRIEQKHCGSGWNEKIKT